MSIRTRLLLLLVCLVVVFGFSAGGLRLAHHQEAERILNSLREERGTLLDNLLSLTGESLHRFASDYSLWDEMVTFTQTVDPTWAAINLDASLTNFNTQAAWVLRPDGSLLYATPGAPPVTLFASPGFIEQLRKDQDLSFFQSSPDMLWEMRTGAILPSDDLQHTQAPHGWLVAARRWDAAHLIQLGNTMQSRATLTPTAAPDPSLTRTAIHLERPLLGWNGQPQARLQVDYESPALGLLIATNVEESFFLYLFGIVTLLAIVITLSRWVIHPLRQLSLSLETGEPEPIRDLQLGSDEFSHLARQAAQSFQQRDALRENESRLRQWMALHDRLGRDMHDGIIQSIYAAGLGLESARNQMHTNPAAAEQRMASCQRIFNDTLWQVRNFMEILEPEHVSTQTPAQSLAALVSTMQALQATPIIAAIDPDLARRIRPQQELHLLHMARELLSNALRHGQAHQILISLSALPDGLACLEVSDDGAGFNPADHKSNGHGLKNLAARASEIGGRLEVDTSPGKGTRITVKFKPLT